KPTLLRCMAGLLRPAAGRVQVLGADPLHERELLSRRMGYMAQRFCLYEELTVAQNVRLWSGLRGVPAHAAAPQAERLLEQADLARFADRLAGKLSGGMKQKLAMVCALCGTPELLLLDEPSVGVDPVSRRELWRMAQEARRTAGSAIVWATSYLDEAARCDRLCMLHEGRVLFLGRPDELPGGDVEGAFIRLLGAGRAAATLTPAPAPPPGAEVVLETRWLTRRFGAFTATDRLSIRVRRGEIFGLLGANGAGKTTAFRMLCGLLPPSSGSASLLGIDLVHHAARARRQLGYMAQKFSLYADLSVASNLAFFAAVYGLRGARKRERTAAVMEHFHLMPYADRPARELPQGIRQRLSLAAATLHEPSFLFLDEPTSGVDPLTRREFWAEINAMSARGITVIVTTHFMDEAQYVHRLVMMNRGQVVAEGTPQELCAAAASPELPRPSMEDAFIHLMAKGGAA
ncbi:MAG: ATP-binding cassette domain-containing protein, partial [Akkermansia sp.]